MGSKSTQIKFFASEPEANDFMVDLEVVDIKFQNHGSGHWIMVIYKKWIPANLDIDELMEEEITE